MFYLIILFIFKPLLWLIFRPKVSGKENIKPLKETGYIVISNHTSYRDPVLIALTIGYRKLFFMAKKELFHGAFGWLIRALNAFAIDRHSSDTRGIRKAMSVIKEGDVCLIFPEGRRSHTDEILPLEKGVAFITMQCKAPVLPAYIGRGSKRGRVLIHYGKPIDIAAAASGFSKAERLKGVTEILHDAIVELQNEQKRVSS